jgi:putative sigma-54 modulation protein
MNAEVKADELHKALAFLVDKLDRMLERRSHIRKSKRRNLRAIELGVALPKAI